jgi:hypothetical protein
LGFWGFVMLGVGARSAHADVVLESYVDRRPPDAERAAVERFKAALQRHGVATKPEQIIAAIGAHVPLPGYPDREVTRTQLIQQIEKATNRAAHEAYDEAVTILVSVFRDLDANPALAVSDPESRSWITKGRVALAFAYARSKRLKQANKVVLDHIRSYPDASLKEEHEEVEKLYTANMAAIAGAARGRLVVRVSRLDAEIFVNAVRRGVGTIDLPLLAGEYSVVVRAAPVYLSYRMTVRPNERAERVIDWSLDSAFTVARDWIGLVAPRGSQRDVAGFAQQLAERATSGAVIVVGLVSRDGRRYVAADRYEAAPGPHRPGRAVSAEPASDAQIEALAAYVTVPTSELTKLPSKELTPIPGDEKPVVRQAAGVAGSGPARWPVLVAVGIVSTAVPAGAYVLKTRNDCYVHCSKTTLRVGLGLVGLGGVALGFGIAWVVHAEHAASTAPPVLDVQPLSGGGIARINWIF